MKKKKSDLDYWIGIMDNKFRLGLVCDHYFISGDDLFLKIEETEYLLNKKSHKLGKKWTRSGASRTKWKS